MPPPAIVWIISVMAVLTHRLLALVAGADDKLIVASGLTVMLPLAVVCVQVPVVVTV